MAEALTERHSCDCSGPAGGWGSAVDVCEEREDGTLWVANSEYESQVNYCPWCGYRARVPVPVQEELGRPVCQEVLHCQGGFYRAYRGARMYNHALEVESTYWGLPEHTFERILPAVVHPDWVVVKLDGHLLYEGYGTLHRMAGRRYPAVLHTFVIPNGELH